MEAIDGSGRRAYLVERYILGITWADVVDSAARIEREAVTLRNNGTDLRWRGSLLIPSDEAVFCVFESESADVVREAHRRAGVAVSRVVEVLVLSAHAFNGPRPVERRVERSLNAPSDATSHDKQRN